MNIKRCKKCGVFLAEGKHICRESVWNKGKKGLQIAWNKGKKFSLISRKKMSKSMKGRNVWNKGKENFHWKGEKNPNWKNGITPLTKMIRHHFNNRQWRSDVFTRDDFTCQECGDRNGNGHRVILHAHHIKKFSTIMQEYKIQKLEDALNCEELWNINNGITLCNKCHKITAKTAP